MKSLVKMNALVAVALAILMVSQTVSAAPLYQVGSYEPVSHYVYDNFDDNITSSALWYTELKPTGPTIAEANHRLEITLPADSAGAEFAAWYDSNCQLHGDYDIQVDYALLTWPLSNGVRIGFAENHINMERTSFAAQNDYLPGAEVYLIDYSGVSQIITATSDFSGKLRLVRVGSTLTGYYDNNGTWVSVSSNSDPAFVEDTAFYLGAWSHDGVFADQEVKLAFDNLVINSGMLSCPVSTTSHVTINQAAGQADPTAIGPVLFTATFDQAVTGFGDASNDVLLSGTAGATTAVVAEIEPYDGTTYSVTVSGMTAPGTVIASIPAGAAVDANNNTNAASTSSDNTVTFTPPMAATAKITPYTTTCSQFASSTSSDLNEIFYSLRNGRVESFNPTNLIYYTRVVAPAATFNINVTQYHTTSWPNLLLNPQLYTRLYDANCNRVTVFVSRSYLKSPTAVFTVRDATPGAVYYLSAYYQVDLLWKAVKSSNPNVPYTIKTSVNYTLLETSSDTVTFRLR